MLLLSSDFFQHKSKYEAVFSEIEDFLRDDKLTLSISQKSVWGGGGNCRSYKGNVKYVCCRCGDYGMGRGRILVPVMIYHRLQICRDPRYIVTCTRIGSLVN